MVYFQYLNPTIYGKKRDVQPCETFSILGALLVADPFESHVKETVTNIAMHLARASKQIHTGPERDENFCFAFRRKLRVDWNFQAFHVGVARLARFEP